MNDKYTLTVRLEPVDRYNLRLTAAARNTTIGELVKELIIKELYGKETSTHENNSVQIS